MVNNQRFRQDTVALVKHKLRYPVPVADITASFDIADNNFLETLDGY